MASDLFATRPWMSKPYITSISASWATSGANAKHGQAVDFINFSLWLYDRIYNVILTQCTGDPQREKRLRWMFEHACHGNAPEDGWGSAGGYALQLVGEIIGAAVVSDMHEAKSHASKKAAWSDSAENLYTYTTGFAQLYDQTYFNAPAACCAFVRALEARLAQLQRKCLEFETLGQQLKQAQKSYDVKFLGDTLTLIKNSAERVECLTWMVPQPALVDAIEGAKGKVDTYCGVIEKIHVGAETIEAVIKQGGSTSQALALATVQVALTYVPVLGSVYGEAIKCMIEGLPGVIETFQKRQDILDRVIKGYFLESDFSYRPPHAGGRKPGPVGV